MSDKLLSERQDGVLTLTLNRPDRLNAIDIDMLDMLVSALDEGGKDDEIGAIVLKGAGRVFCAGADIGQMIDRTPADWQDIVDHYLDPIRLISTIEKPIIARCHGDVIGGGLGPFDDPWTTISPVNLITRYSHRSNACRAKSIVNGLLHSLKNGEDELDWSIAES